MLDIKAIETKYAGCRFRSRLEARWAVFFDTWGVPWEYEPEGFTLSNGTRYLPDFLLTESGTWVEVKGSEAALNKDLMFQAASDLGELLILGPIPDPTPFTQKDRGCWGRRDLTWIDLTDRYDDEPVSILRVGLGAYHYHGQKRPWVEYGLEGPLWLTPVRSETLFGDPYNAEYAYTAARSARFEYGDRLGDLITAARQANLDTKTWIESGVAA